MLESPEVHHHSKKHGVLHWFEIVMSVSVLMLSGGSLYIALHTGHTMERLVEQNQRLVEANSLPLLMLDYTDLSEKNLPDIRLTLKNAGAGPARIGWLSLKYKDREYTRIAQLIDTMSPVDIAANEKSFFMPVDIDKMPAASGIGGKVLATGQKDLFFSWPRPDVSKVDALAAWQVLNAQASELDFSACYCSIFGRCWIDEFDGNAPEEIASCALDKRSDLKP